MRPLAHISLLSLILLVTGCALFVPEESRYLRSAQDQATQEDVLQRLGQPRSTATTQMGEAVWVYEVRSIEPMSQNSWATLGSWCSEYILTFDKSGILRQWTHKSYVHGGELMPLSCNSTVGVQKPAL